MVGSDVFPIEKGPFLGEIRLFSGVYYGKTRWWRSRDQTWSHHRSRSLGHWKFQTIRQLFAGQFGNAMIAPQPSRVQAFKLLGIFEGTPKK